MRSVTLAISVSVLLLGEPARALLSDCAARCDPQFKMMASKKRELIKSAITPKCFSISGRSNLIQFTPIGPSSEHLVMTAPKSRWVRPTVDAGGKMQVLPPRSHDQAAGDWR